MMYYACFIGIITISTLPISICSNEFFIDWKGNEYVESANNIVVNAGFFLMFFGTRSIQKHQRLEETKWLEKSGFHKRNEVLTMQSLKLDEFDLTKREIEIAFLILDKRSYNEISDDLFIAPKTVSKHASNIFKKTKCNSKKDFIDQFVSN